LVAPDFVPIGVVGRADDGGPALLARMPGVADGHRQNGSGEPRGPSGLETRAGVIEIDLPGGARLRVDALVNGRALARVLSALKRCR
jgi:transposase